MLITLSSICVAQIEKDTVSIYWPNEQLKYRTVCCFIDTTDAPDSAEPFLVQTRSIQMWDENGNTIYLEDYIETHKDIVIIEQNEGIGEDEKEYRNLIALADKAFDLIDTGNLDSVNRAIKSYVKAKKKIPDAIYPKQKLKEIQELLRI